jgi:hypothetical protein
MIASACLLAGALACLTALEGATRLGFERVSRVHSVMASEWRDAVRPPLGGRPVVLLAGNSLLDAGVPPDALNPLRPGIDARRLVVLNTTYIDWYYAAHRLFDEGARPTVLVLAMSDSQLAGMGTQGDYAARYLMRFGDVIPAAKDSGLDLNRTSSMLVAHVSAFWGARAHIRSWILKQVSPTLPLVIQSWTLRPALQLEPSIMAGRLRSHLAQLSRFTRQYGCDLVWMVPPTGDLDARRAELLRSIGRSASVRVEVPIEAYMGNEFYSDGFHLNQRGARVFTDAVLASIRALAIDRNSR